MKKSLEMFFLCAVIAAAMWVGILPGTLSEILAFENLAGIWHDTVNVDLAWGYIHDKWPLIRQIFEMMFRFLVPNGC